MPPSIDLNSDVGESFGNWRMGDDAAMFDSVSSANVACGFHAGDATTIAATCRAAVEAGVVIGAHIGYRDLAGFGRRFIDVDLDELRNDVIYQLGALRALAEAAGGSVEYVKPHGALYTTMAHHEGQAQAVIDGIRTFDDSLPVLLLPGSVGVRTAEAAGLRAVAEAFADRAYEPDGSLVSRTKPGAVLHDVDTVITNMTRRATDGTIVAIDGTVVRPNAESICLHGDTPGTVAMAAAVRSALEAAGVTIAPFAGATASRS